MDFNDSNSQAFESDALRQSRMSPTRGGESAEESYNDASTVPERRAPSVRRRSRNTAPRQEQEPLTDETREERPKEQPSTKPGKIEQPKKKVNDSKVKRAESNEPSAWRQTASFLTDSRWPLFFGIICILVSLYAVIASVSYFYVGVKDQSLLHSLPLQELVERAGDLKNITGPLGAKLSYWLYAKGFGLGSVCVIAYVFCLGLMLVKQMRPRYISLTFKSFISAIAISDICALAMFFNEPSSIFWGGAHGYLLNELLINWSGIYGAVCIAVVMASVLILIFISQVSAVCGVIGSVWSRYAERRRERRARRDAARQARRAEELRRSRADEEEDEEQIEEEESVEIPSDGGHETYAVNEHGVASMIDPDEESDRQESPIPASEPARNQAHEPRQVTLQPVVDKYDEVEKQPSRAEKVVEEMPEIPIADDEPQQLDDLPEIEVVDYADEPTDETPEPEEDVKPAGEVVVAPPIVEAERVSEMYDPTAELRHFHKPEISILTDRPIKAASADAEEIEENQARITAVLESFGVAISSINATVGPTITLYEIVPAEGIRIKKIASLGDDIALRLSATGSRIIAPIPGRGTIGIEVPNKDAQIVPIRNILGSQAYQDSKAALPLAMGATISNDVYIADLADIPHLLVAGSTGTGKSVGLNTMIASLLYKKHPAEVKFVLIDPKSVEFAIYSAIERHYLAKLPGEDEPIVTDMTKVVPTLNSVCVEMDQRYELLKKAGVRHVTEYNKKFVEHRLKSEDGHRYLPYIVVVIDEFADLIMTAGKEVEMPIARIAQKARAVGIHVILATQRPSANVITGVIRANFPGRVAFRVTQALESRIILDQRGADQLVGKGDMLFSRGGELQRVQCALITTEEVQAMCDAISNQVGYPDAYLLPEYTAPSDQGSSPSYAGSYGDRDPYFLEAGRAVLETGTASTTFLQRRLELGYPRAGKIMDQLERAGVVGPSQGSKPRAVLMSLMDFEMTYGQQQ